MTRFVVDCGVVLHLASEGIEVPAGHELLAPTLLRSQTLSALHEAVHRAVPRSRRRQNDQQLARPTKRILEHVARMTTPYGRYWARTSDPQLVDSGRAFARVR